MMRQTVCFEDDPIHCLTLLTFWSKSLPRNITGDMNPVGSYIEATVESNPRFGISLACLDLNSNLKISLSPSHITPSAC